MSKATLAQIKFCRLKVINLKRHIYTTKVKCVNYERNAPKGFRAMFCKRKCAQTDGWCDATTAYPQWGIIRDAIDNNNAVSDMDRQLVYGPYIFFISHTFKSNIIHYT